MEKGVGEEEDLGDEVGRVGERGGGGIEVGLILLEVGVQLGLLGNVNALGPAEIFHINFVDLCGRHCSHYEDPQARSTLLKEGSRKGSAKRTRMPCMLHMKLCEATSR
jgi:hypothetical protein